MRAVYVLLTYVLAPVVIALEGWKALWNPEYRGRLHQRLGFVAEQDRPGWRWVNAHDARRLVARRLVANGASEQQLCELLGLTHVRAARALLMGEERPTKLVARNLV